MKTLKHENIKNKKYLHNRGFTLVEFIIYIVIVGAVLVSLVNFTWTILSNYQKQTLYQEVRQNGSFVLDMINQQIKAASEVVETDSVFNVHPGVLKLDTNTIPFTCGNGSIDLGEYCDGSNLGGQTCQGFYLLGGTLTCNQYCRYDISGCSAYTLFRKKIVITNNSSQLLQNYQVLIYPLNKEEGMDSNFSNLIFLDIETKNQLPYWVEDKGVDWARIWVKIVSISANSSKNLFLYYGNTGVSGKGGDPSLVMDKAENFEGASSYLNTLFNYNISNIGFYDPYCDSSSCTQIISPGKSLNSAFRIKKGTESAQNGCTSYQWGQSAGVASAYYGVSSDFLDMSKRTIEFWMKSEMKTRTDITQNGYSVVYFIKYATKPPATQGYAYELGFIGMMTNNNVDYKLVYSTANSPSDPWGYQVEIPSVVNYGQWYKFILYINQDSKKWNFHVLDSNYNLVYSKNDLNIVDYWWNPGSIGSYSKDFFLRMTGFTCGKTDFDLFFSRKYASPEPTVSILDDCVNSWPVGISSGEITFDTVEKNINQGGQSVTIRKLRVGEDICPSVEITSDAVNVKNFVLKNLMPIGADKENIQVNLTLEAVNPRNTKEYQAEINWQTSVNLRL